jgi:hypothetical protein
MDLMDDEWIGMDEVDRELERELRRAENGGRDVGVEEEEDVEGERKEQDVRMKKLPARAVPRFREHTRDRSPTMRAMGVGEVILEESKGRREGESWQMMMRRQRKEKNGRKKLRRREDVERIRRKEVTAEEVFLERMGRSVKGAEKRTADGVKKAERKRMRKAVWVERKRELRVAAAVERRGLARGGRPTGEFKVGGSSAGAGTSGVGAPSGSCKVRVETADATLSERVTALEGMLKKQMEGEQKRVEEAYEEGMAAQGRKSLEILEEVREKGEAKERKRTWEREEEKRKVQKEERRRHGTTVQDRLSRKRDDGVVKRLPARAVPRFRVHAKELSPTMRAVEKHSTRGEGYSAGRPASTVAKTSGYGRGRAVSGGTGVSGAAVTDYRLRAPRGRGVVQHRNF